MVSAMAEKLCFLHCLSFVQSELSNFGDFEVLHKRCLTFWRFYLQDVDCGHM